MQVSDSVPPRVLVLAQHVIERLRRDLYLESAHRLQFRLDSMWSCPLLFPSLPSLPLSSPAIPVPRSLSKLFLQSQWAPASWTPPTWRPSTSRRVWTHRAGEPIDHPLLLLQNPRRVVTLR